MMLERLGLHELAVTKARSNRMPSRASLSMLGVLTFGFPKAPQSSQAMSSAMIRTTLGRFGPPSAWEEAIVNPQNSIARVRLRIAIPRGPGEARVSSVE